MRRRNPAPLVPLLAAALTGGVLLWSWYQTADRETVGEGDPALPLYVALGFAALWALG